MRGPGAYVSLRGKTRSTSRVAGNVESPTPTPLRSKATNKTQTVNDMFTQEGLAFNGKTQVAGIEMVREKRRIVEKNGMGRRY